MTEIALAYSSIDKARAEAIARVLGALGYKTSAQPLTPAAVDAASALVVFWSSGSVNSIPINQLAAQASCDKKLVCVRAGHADPPAAYALVALHDLSRWTGSLDAPELRTFLQHLLRMAPPANAAQQQAAPPVAAAPPPRAPVMAAGNAAPFAFAGPLGAATRPGEARIAFAPNRAVGLAPTPAPAPAAAASAAATPISRPPVAPPPIAAVPSAPLAPAPRPATERPPIAARRAERPEDRPAVRRAAERRRAAGGGVARVAFGAIAVSVIAGAAVAAFNYDPNQQRAAASPETDNAADIAIAVAPNALSEPSPATDATPDAAAAAGVQVAAAAPLPAPLAAPAAPPVATPPATLQSNRGWTASLPTLPATERAGPRATPVSAGAPPRAPVRSTRLTAVDARPAPAPTDLVAVDNANLGGEPANALRPRTPEEERAWIRQNGEYGPTP